MIAFAASRYACVAAALKADQRSLYWPDYYPREKQLLQLLDRIVDPVLSDGLRKRHKALREGKVPR